jgi:predicted molibdopterin-dependent oxidoreductase YjgC
MKQITLTIDGKAVTGVEGQTIMEVAREKGIDIPSLCYHPRLSKSGACRVCLVRINGKMLKASCCEPATEGMDVVTEDEGIAKVRKWILELLLAEGDHNCLYCDANGACELQALIQRYGLEPTEVASGVRRERTVDYVSSPALKRNENRCILCGRCVRACKEVQVSRVWGFAERGSGTHLIVDDDKPWGDSTSCTKCGTCVQLCPTGALSYQTVLGRGANWELKKESSICIYCGVGCKIDYYTNKQGQLVKTLGNEDGPNKGHLCIKGRFGFDFVQNDKRLSKPLIKKDGAFVEAGWDEALSLVADKLSAIKGTHGPDSIAALSSAKCTNEENYLMQKFMRAVVGTNNIDHCARL